MALIVHKYGGTSMGSTERIRNVAKRVAKWHRAGHQLVVVPSAMSGETNRLLALAKELAPAQPGTAYSRELDALAATGEQASSALLAMALQAEGLDAVSYAGWQVPIKTNNAYTKARIESIDDQRVRADLNAGKVVIVTGFQGVDPEGNITTLGRGGSDTSAVAVAAALKADECLIYTDVDGVYTTDPRIVAKARKLKNVTYEEMLELASVGSKVLQTRSVSLAMKEKVRVQVLSSFVDEDAPSADTLPGTMIVSDEEVAQIAQEGLDMERQLITGIAADKNEAKITLTRVADRPGAVASIFGPLAAASINVDMIIQNIAKDKGETDVTFTVPKADLLRTQALLEERKEAIGYFRTISDDKVAKVSVVGVGMRSHAGVAATMFKSLAERGINVQAISTSEIKISVLIDEDETELAVRVLHTAYGLDAA